MSSMLAVMAQMALSASNYAVFVLLARLLDEPGFIAFSTAVGLNMLAYAIAEGGVSYVAPKALAERPDREAAPLAGSFVILSGALYVASMGLGYLLWNALAAEPLATDWVLAYAAFFLPALAMPAWATARAIDRVSVAGVALARVAMVLLVGFWPSTGALAAGGAGFALVVVWLLQRANRRRPTIGRPGRASLRTAMAGLREVFVARTMSYAVYALLPLLVGVLRGNAAAATYVTAERLKSLYATLFQPLIQSLYLWQFQRAGSADGKLRAAGWALQGLNLLVCAAAVAASANGLLGLLGARFAELPLPPVMWLAAGLSVATACLLHFHVFPGGQFGLFRRATVVQMLAFGATALALGLVAGLSPVWLLFAGEAALLAAVGVLMGWRRARAAGD